MKLKLLLLLLMVQSTCILAQPSMEINGGRIHDFGTLPVIDTILSKDIILKNTGDSPLEISDFMTDGTDFKAQCPKNIIAPGEEVKITVQFSTAGFKGRVFRTMSFQTNIPEKKRIIFMFKAFLDKNIGMPLSIEPNELLEKVFIDSENIYNITISNQGEETISLTKIQSDTDDIVLNSEGDISLAPGGTFDLEIIYYPVEPGSFIYKIQIETTSDKQPFIEIPLNFRNLVN